MTCETCIMEDRIKGLEDRANKQAEDKVESVKQMTAMQKDIEQIFRLTKDMNKKLDDVLSEQQKRAIKDAAEKNKAAATKWQSLSTETKGWIKFVFMAAATVLIGYGLSRMGLK